MTHVVLEHLTKVYLRENVDAIHDISLDMPDGKITALLGPSGSGKSTTLKLIAGLIFPTHGAIYFDGVDVCLVPAEKRSAVMVFQNHLLFPHMTVAENIGFGLRMRGVDKHTRRKRINEMLDLVQLPGLGDRKPGQLSGGQQQRIALARALVTEPSVLLLDEPLSNLDVHLRDEMRELIRRVQGEFNITTIMVTHDQQEAVVMADDIALLFDGRLQQYAVPSAFYRRPATEEIARFFGGVNFIKGKAGDCCIDTDLGRFTVQDDNQQRGLATMTIRPEQIRFVDADGPNTVCGHVQTQLYAGTFTRYRVSVGDHTLEALRSADLPGQINEGDEVYLHLPPDHIWLLPPA